LFSETVEYAFSLLQIATLPLPGKFAFLNAKLAGKPGIECNNLFFNLLTYLAIYFVMETLRAGFSEPFILCGVCDVLMNLVSISDIGFDELVQNEKYGRLISESSVTVNISSFLQPYYVDYVFDSDRHDANENFHAMDLIEKEIEDGGEQVRENKHNDGNMDVDDKEKKIPSASTASYYYSHEKFNQFDFT
jgi:hypothetical protein